MGHFLETQASFTGCDVGGKVIELEHKTPDVGDPQAVGHPVEHALIVGGVADIGPSFPFGGEIAVEQALDDPLCALALVVFAEPAVDVDGADALSLIHI